MLEFFSKTQHTRHLLQLVDKMSKYNMDLASIAEDTEQTWFCQQPDNRTDGRTDGRTDWQGETRLPPSTSLSGGYDENKVWTRGIILEMYYTIKLG